MNLIRKLEIDMELCESARQSGWSCPVKDCANALCNKNDFDCFKERCDNPHKNKTECKYGT